MGIGAPSGTVTFLFTDIESSTRLWEAAPESMAVAMARHDALVHAAVDAHDGYVFATGGDGFAVAFTRAGDAVRAAAELQQAFTAEPWPAPTPIRVRMALHTGEVAEREGDYFGTPVNQTARLMALGHGGQILISSVTAGLLPPDVRLVDLGTHRLRDLSAPQRVYQVGDGRFPPLRSVDAVPTNLPVVVTELIGRSDDRDRIAALLQRERLVTLTGVGGIGKTRLALAVAAAVAPSFPDGCWFAELAPANTGDELVQAVAAAMGTSARDRAELCRYVADRHLLIILDNCEHVLTDAARLAESLIRAGPEVFILATSREPLAIAGEVLRGVPSLAIPTDEVSAADALDASAVRLFVERATAATDRFVLDDDNVGTVVAICRQLDGIPLALELAAARVRSMTPAEIARRLSERFRLLAGGRASLERHRTLLGTVSWSHDLLTDDERRLFRRLAVFPATFDLDAAAAIAADNSGIDTVDCVLRLVDRSLVTYDPTSGRYRLLETLRQYGADRLADTGETIETRDRHAAHYMQIAPALNWSTRRLWAELDNLRAAADWLTDQQRWTDLLAVARALFPIGVTTAAGDALGWYEAALDHLDDVDIQARVDALGELGHIETRIGRDVGTGAWRMSIALADEQGAPHSQWAWHAETMASLYEGDKTGARRAEERAIAIARDRHDSFCLVVASSTLAFVLASLGELDESRRLADRALRDAQAAGHPEGLAIAIVCTAASLINSQSRPDFGAARRFLDEHPLNLADVSGTIGVTYLQEHGTIELGLGLLDSAIGRLVEAVRLGDRTGGSYQMHQAAYALGVTAAETGAFTLACELVGCADTHLAASRIANNLQGWLEDRLDAVLADLDLVERARATDRGAALDRRGLMRLLRRAEELIHQAG